MKKYIILASMAIMLLVLAGCGGEEKPSCPPVCNDFDPCTADSCSEFTGFVCQYTPIPGCTNECGTPCSGPVGMYMEMKCDSTTKQCAADVKEGIKISTSSLTNEMLSMGTKFKVITTFNQPFNMKKELFNIKMSLSQFGTGISDIKIKKIEITGIDANRQTVTLGEKIINKYIWDLETAIEDGVRIDFPTSDDDGQFTNFKMRIIYEYKQVFGGQTQTKSANFEITLRGVTFSWIRPGITYECPASCDDGNEGTADICNAQTDYFCVNQPIPGKCGNYVCDATENKCKCAEDCGPCTGNIGKYLSYTCQSNECKTMIQMGVVQQPKTITDDKNRNFYFLQNRYTFPEPFNVKTDQFQIEFKLYDKQDAVGDITLIEAKVLDRTTEVAYAPIGSTLKTIGDTVNLNIPVTTFVGTEESKALSLRIDIEYDYITATGTDNRKDSFIATLGTVTIINPTIT